QVPGQTAQLARAFQVGQWAARRPASKAGPPGVLAIGGAGRWPARPGLEHSGALRARRVRCGGTAPATPRGGCTRVGGASAAWLPSKARARRRVHPPSGRLGWSRCGGLVPNRVALPACRRAAGLHVAGDLATNRRLRAPAALASAIVGFKGESSVMSLSDRLRELADRLPPGGSLTLPRD